MLYFTCKKEKGNKKMKYIIEEELYDKISTLLCNYEDLLERLGEEYRNDLLEDDWNTFSGLLDEYDSLPVYKERKVEEEKKEEKRKPIAGDRVRVIESGECYTTYSDWVEKYITEPSERYLWDYGMSCYNGDVGEVLHIESHEYGNATLAYVKMDNGKCYLIGTKGLEII
jgi:hypothetical protein